MQLISEPIRKLKIKCRKCNICLSKTEILGFSTITCTSVKNLGKCSWWLVIREGATPCTPVPGHAPGLTVFGCYGGAGVCLSAHLPQTERLSETCNCRMKLRSGGNTAPKCQRGYFRVVWGSFLSSLTLWVRILSQPATLSSLNSDF